jgi:hypothetical protein
MEQENVQNLIPLVFIGLFVYLIFSRKGGMGCCGGHGAHKPEQHKEVNPGKLPHDSAEKVIEQGNDEYKILHSKIINPPK